MQSIYKKKSLNELYHVLNSMLTEDITLRYPIEVKEMNNGLAFKIFTSTENLTLFFYPGHAVSEFNIIKNGMRFIYPKRMIKFKRHTIGDLMQVISADDRMQGYTKVVEMYLIAIFRSRDLVYKNIKTS